MRGRGGPADELRRVSDIKNTLDENMPPQQETEAIVRPAVTYAAQDLRDPFKMVFDEDKNSPNGPAAVEVPLPELTVQGVIWGTGTPQAIINNKVVKVGDTVVPGVRVIDISKEAITVFFGTRNYTLSSPAMSFTQSTEQKGGQTDEKKSQ